MRLGKWRLWVSGAWRWHVPVPVACQEETQRQGQAFHLWVAWVRALLLEHIVVCWSCGVMGLLGLGGRGFHPHKCQYRHTGDAGDLERKEK